MIGYYRMPGATAEADDEEGWLHTGDLAVRQPDGCLRITGKAQRFKLRDAAIRKLGLEAAS